MSTAAVSASPLSSGVQSFIEQRDAGLKQLGKALQAGDLATAQLAFQAIQSLSQNNSAANGNSFKVAGRQQDFAAIGQTLQSGDLAGAQQALVQLRKSVQPQRNVDPPPATVVNLGGPSSGKSAAPSSTGSQSAATSSTGSA